MAAESGYFVIVSCEDGIDIDGPLTEANLLEMIRSEYWGERSKRFYAKLPHICQGNFEERDGQERILIVKGSVVVPEVVQVVTEYKLPRG